MAKKPGMPAKIITDKEAENLDSESLPSAFPTIWESHETVKLNITVKDVEGKIVVDEDVGSDVDAVINKHVFLAHAAFLKEVALDLSDEESLEIVGFDGLFRVLVPFSEILEYLLELGGPEERLQLEAWRDTFERAVVQINKRLSEMDNEKD